MGRKSPFGWRVERHDRKAQDAFGEVDPEVLEAIRSRVLEASEALVEVMAKKRDEAEGEREERFRAGMKAGAEIVADMLKNTFDRISRFGL